jgi:hypothetical protein
MIQNITEIVIACAAVIGLVPLGIRSIRDLVRSRTKKKSNEWLGTIGLSVLLSLIAPSVLEAVARHVHAAGEALPDWVKAAVPEQSGATPPGAESAQSPAVPMPITDPGNGRSQAGAAAEH